MESTETTLSNSALPSQVLTIPGWGSITVDQLDSPFEDDDIQLYSCTLCDETFSLPSSLKKHERLRHRNKRQRRNSSPQSGPSGLQLTAGTRKRQRRDSSLQAAPSNLQLSVNDTRKHRAALKTFEVAELFLNPTISKDIDFIVNENNLNVVCQQYFSKEEADQIFEELERKIEYFPSEMATVVIYNKKYPVPRKVAAYGDKNLTYTFSGSTLPTKPLIPILIKILKEANKFLKEGSFNYVLINRYKDGHDKIGSHKDNEKDMDPDSAIVTFSFGTERTMIFKRPNFDPVKIPLKNGSALVMNPPTNEFWYHEIPREKKIKDVRISLTFRKNLSSACKKCL